MMAIPLLERDSLRKRLSRGFARHSDVILNPITETLNKPSYNFSPVSYYAYVLRSIRPSPLGSCSRWSVLQIFRQGERLQ